MIGVLHNLRFRKASKQGSTYQVYSIFHNEICWPINTVFGVPFSTVLWFINTYIYVFYGYFPVVNNAVTSIVESIVVSPCEVAKTIFEYFRWICRRGRRLCYFPCFPEPVMASWIITCIYSITPVQCILTRALTPPPPPPSDLKDEGLVFGRRFTSLL